MNEIQIINEITSVSSDIKERSNEYDARIQDLDSRVELLIALVADLTP